MQREKWHLDRKRDKERQKQEHLGSWREFQTALVYRTNFTSAYTRRSCPQMPISSAIGINITSQKRKKRKRSSERNTPTTPTSSISSITKNSLTRRSMLFHDARIEIGVRNVVRITRNILIPSTPR